MKQILTVSTLLITIVSCSQPRIDQLNVSRIITTLAADDMQGRGNFSPELDMAADFISQEFESIGLEHFAGLANYRQTFSLYSIKVDSSNVMLNGDSISQSNYFISLDNEKIDWNNESPVIVTYIRAEDDFREEFQRIRRNDDNLVVVVDVVHQDIFQRFSRFYRRPSNMFSLGNGRSIVFILSDEDKASLYHIRATANVKKQTMANIVGVIHGKRKDEFVLFSGHYDHIGILKPEDGDSIANGANDDASGTTAIIELARHYQAKGRPERNLIFAAFTGEEIGGFGSRYFSEQLNADQIIVMFNIEMIGKPSKEGPNTAWITGWDKSNLGILLKQSAEGSIYKFYADPYPDQNLFYRSDNATLARLGVPAHSISTTQIDIDQDYHNVSDEVGTLDLEHLTNTIKAIAHGADGFVSGKLTPTRVDKTTIR